MSLKGKKILVTGADGFIGSHLVERLVHEGCRVRAFVYYNSFGSWGWLDSADRTIIDNIEVVAGDIRDKGFVKKAAEGIDIIFHLAALIGIPYSYSAPQSYIDTNITGTLNTLQAGVECGAEKILVTSTSEVYGTAISVPIAEDHPLQGQSPYSASKIGADKIAESFMTSFDAPVTIVRPFNTFGPRQSARAIIPTIITQALDDQKVIKLGSLHPKRDFNYVKDVCGGYVAIAENDKTTGETINIASNMELSIEEVANIIIKKIGSDSRVVLDDTRVRADKSEVLRLLGSNKKINELTGWRGEHSFEQGLNETIKWFKDRENLKRYKAEIYNV